MKKTAYIHIGVPKTGTSAIQSTLQRFFEEGKLDKFDMQFHYLDTFKPAADFIITGDEEYYIKKVHKQIQKYSKLGKKNVIFSNENLACYTTNYNIRFRYELLPVLAKAFKDYEVKIILYMRRQDLLLESLINQLAKAGCNLIYNETNFYYKELIDKCSECFGGEVIVRKYERESLYGKDAVSDFLHAIGLDELIEDYTKNKDESKNANSSLSPSSLRLAITDNKRFQLGEAEKKTIIDEFERQYKNGNISRSDYSLSAYKYSRGCDHRIIQPKYVGTRALILKKGIDPSFSSSSIGLLSAEERNAILDQYSEDNAVVAREYFGNEDGVLFNSKAPKNMVDIRNEPTATDIVQVLMPIIVDLAARCESLEKSTLQRFLDDKLRGYMSKKLENHPKLYEFLNRKYKRIK